MAIALKHRKLSLKHSDMIISIIAGNNLILTNSYKAVLKPS
jgi:hypothetical protein